MFGRGFDSRHLHTTGRECKIIALPFLFTLESLSGLISTEIALSEQVVGTSPFLKINFSGKVEPRIKDFSSNVATAKSFGRFLRK
jgi:hypothetical protein